MMESKDYVPAFTLPREQFQGVTLSAFPFTSVIVIIWSCFIAVTVCLLDRAAATATTQYPAPWWLDWLPAVFLTIFAQGHTAITAMHLGRLAVSALHNQRTSPNSWAELFWMANRNWQGPFGLLGIVHGWTKLTPRFTLPAFCRFFSSTFWLFTITCLLALPAPIVVSRSYPLRTVLAHRATRVRMSMFDPSLLEEISLFQQIGTGGGAWATGLSVTDIYNNSIYAPVGTNRSGAISDFVFAGDASNHELYVPAIRVQGSCQVIDAGAAPTSYSAYQEWCSARLSNNVGYYDGFDTTNAFGNNVSAYWCTTFNPNITTWLNTAPASNATAFIWVGAVNTALSRINGYIQCNSALATGHATVNGLDGSYSNFKQEAFYNTSLLQVGQKPPGDPLYAAMYDVSQLYAAGTEVAGQRSADLLRKFGFTANYTQPSMAQIADGIWTGAANNGIAIGLLALGSSFYNTAEYASVSGRQRNDSWFFGALGLLGGWALLLIFCHVRFWGPTFGDSLDSYVAARLLVDAPHIVSGRCCGGMSINGNLCEPFQRVGDTNPELPLGHIASGGEGKLIPRRVYGRRSSS